MSTMESLFITFELIGREVGCLKSLLTDVLLWRKLAPSITLYCDNMVIILVAMSKAFNRKRRHT